MKPEGDICIRLGIKLRKMRQRRKWGQEDLAAHSGIGRNFISLVENGRREPRLRTLEILANAFDMTVSQFMRGV